jgi:UPF0042 nucleotide-binding protein
MSLTLTLQSFSYKKGIPSDPSGNGGGFVFDCRGIYNPGRIEQYKIQSGLDETVIAFLNDQDEMQVFLQHAIGLVEMSIRNYLERSFEHLHVSFGCTGGQHRSVYAAERMFEFITTEFPQVKIQLTHTNRENWVR